jgi:mRNA-degrading endonuclease RelE of RelBE toxin-antitoxin system
MYKIEYAAEVVEDLADLRAYDRARLLDRIEEQLLYQPTRQTRNRKLIFGVRPPWGQEEPFWELRVEPFRVFYDVEEAKALVTVRAIRRKPPHQATEDIL